MTLRAATEQFVSLADVRGDENCGCVSDSSPDDATVGLLIDQASDALTILSGGKIFGRRTITARPSRVRPTCECTCGCRMDGIPLEGPDPEVAEVKIDGVVLAASEYGLHSGRDGRYYLVRQATGDRPPSWPSCQSDWRPDTEDDTFAITYTYGVHIDWIIERATLELVCDFAADDITKTNQLQPGTTSAILGGVSVGVNSGLTLQERMDRLQSGVLGGAVTRCLSVHAPGGRRESEVWAPELEDWSYSVRR
jgi:hypothetical protein